MQLIQRFGWMRPKSYIQTKIQYLMWPAGGCSAEGDEHRTASALRPTVSFTSKHHLVKLKRSQPLDFKQENPHAQ